MVCFIALSFLRAHIAGDPWQSEISPITGPMYQLFIFFMITDPKTTVRSRMGQCIVAVAIAVLEFFFRLDSSIYAPLYALFWVGPAALLIEMAIDSRRARAAGDYSQFPNRRRPVRSHPCARLRFLSVANAVQLRVHGALLCSSQSLRTMRVAANQSPFNSLNKAALRSRLQPHLRL